MSRRASPALLLLAVGCAAPPPPSTPWAAGAPEPLDGPADAVLAADLNGDGEPEALRVVGRTLHHGGGTLALPGEVHAHAQVRLGGEDVVLVGTGGARGQAGTVALVRLGPGPVAETLWSAESPRAQVVAVGAQDGAPFVAAFTAERTVEAGPVVGGRLQVQASAALALGVAPAGGGQVLVGRLYGDAPRSPGDLALVGPAGRVARPSLRGPRAAVAAQLDGDDALELVVADGWDAAYAASADPRLVLLDGPQDAAGRVIGWLDGDYTANAIEPLGRGPGAALVVSGARGAWLLQRDTLGWSATRVGPLTETARAAVWEHDGAAAVLLPGAPALRVPLVRVAP
jgi:hypothetical protein